MRLRYTPGYAPNSDLTQPCGGGTYEKEFFPLFSYKAKNLFLKENSRDLQSQQEAREMGACPKDFCIRGVRCSQHLLLQANRNRPAGGLFWDPFAVSQMDLWGRLCLFAHHGKAVLCQHCRQQASNTCTTQHKGTQGNKPLPCRDKWQQMGNNHLAPKDTSPDEGYCKHRH